MRLSEIMKWKLIAFAVLFAAVPCFSQIPVVEPLALETLASKEPPSVAELITKAAPKEDSFATMAKSDPVAAFREALKRYQSHVDDYTCMFEKQERLAGRLTEDQVIQVKFREKPFSVNMLWVLNEDKARRVVYVENRWTGKHGEEMAAVEPAGSIARLFVRDVLRPIHGEEAQQASRKPIDQFGFANTLRRIISICELGAKNHDLNLRFTGEGTQDGQPTYMFERRLPYTQEGGTYPDRLLVVHLDQQHLLPVSCYSYGDENKTLLLGKYVVKNARFNVGLSDGDFARKGG